MKTTTTTEQALETLGRLAATEGTVVRVSRLDGASREELAAWLHGLDRGVTVRRAADMIVAVEDLESTVNARPSKIR